MAPQRPLTERQQVNLLLRATTPAPRPTASTRRRRQPRYLQESVSATDYASWTKTRRRMWDRRRTDPEAYLMHYLLPHETPRAGTWRVAEHTHFLAALRHHCPSARAPRWGAFSVLIPGRVGAECRRYFHRIGRAGFITLAGRVRKRLTCRGCVGGRAGEERLVSRNAVFLRRCVRKFMPQSLPGVDDELLGMVDVDGGRSRQGDDKGGTEEIPDTTIKTEGKSALKSEVPACSPRSPVQTGPCKKTSTSDANARPVQRKKKKKKKATDCLAASKDNTTSTKKRADIDISIPRKPPVDSNKVSEEVPQPDTENVQRKSGKASTETCPTLSPSTLESGDATNQTSSAPSHPKAHTKNASQVVIAPRGKLVSPGDKYRSDAPENTDQKSSSDKSSVALQRIHRRRVQPGPLPFVAEVLPSKEIGLHGVVKISPIPNRPDTTDQNVPCSSLHAFPKSASTSTHRTDGKRSGKDAESRDGNITQPVNRELRLTARTLNNTTVVAEDKPKTSHIDTHAAENRDADLEERRRAIKRRVAGVFRRRQKKRVTFSDEVHEVRIQSRDTTHTDNHPQDSRLHADASLVTIREDEECAEATGCTPGGVQAGCSADTPHAPKPGSLGWQVATNAHGRLDVLDGEDRLLPQIPRLRSAPVSHIVQQDGAMNTENPNGEIAQTSQANDIPPVASDAAVLQRPEHTWPAAPHTSPIPTSMSPDDDAYSDSLDDEDMMLDMAPPETPGRVGGEEVVQPTEAPVHNRRRIVALDGSERAALSALLDGRTDEEGSRKTPLARSRIVCRDDEVAKPVGPAALLRETLRAFAGTTGADGVALGHAVERLRLLREFERACTCVGMSFDRESAGSDGWRGILGEFYERLVEMERRQEREVYGFGCVVDVL